MATINYEKVIPKELQALPIWGLFITEPQPGKDKLKKLALSPQSGKPLSTNVPAQWGSFSQAFKAYQRSVRNAKGLAMLVQPPYTVIDLDHTTVDSPTDAAKDFLELTKGTYTERSVSGEGIHAIIRGNNDTGRKRNDKAGLEVYSSLRFFAITGDVVDGAGVIRSIPDDELNPVLEKYLAPRVPDKPTQGTESGGTSYLTDEQVIQRAIKAKNGDLFKTLFLDGWDVAGYASQSEGDVAFANMLAFWTNKDFPLMDSIFRESALMREKWDKKRGKETYGAMTLNNAIQHTHETYNPHPRKLSAAEEFSDWIEEDGTGSGKPHKNSVKQPLDLVNEGLTPFPILAVKKPWDGNIPIDFAENQQAYSDKVNAQTPSWLSVWLELSKPKPNALTPPSLVVKHRIIETVLGDSLIEQDHLLAFPELKGGAAYDNEQGYWSVFKDNTAINYIEAKLTRILVVWGIYDNGAVITVRKYVERMMFHSEIKENPFDKSKPHLAVFSNGTFNMKTNEMQDNSYRDFILNGHNYQLDTSGRPTPETDSMFTEMVGDAYLFLKEFIGYGFYRSYAPFQKILFFYGNGGEGKSTMIGYITDDIFGSHNISTVAPEDLTGNDNRFKPALLYGKEVNSVADIDKGYLANTAILKRLSGGEDWTSGEFKGMQNFQFKNYAKLLFSANDLPSFTDTSGGFRERLAVINFLNGDTRVMPGKSFWKRHSVSKVKAERSAFVYECIQCFIRALDRRQLSLTDSMKKSRDEWVGLNDHFGQFLDEACELDPTGDSGDSAKSVVAEYRAFCRENNYSDKTTSQTITENLKKQGIVRIRSRRGHTDKNNVWRFKGLTLTKSYLNPAIDDFP